jgi:hypothetical protein
MKRRYLIASGILAAGIGVVLGVLAILPEPGVTKATLVQVEDGMTAQDVEVLIRVPPSLSVGATVTRNGVSDELWLRRWCNADGSAANIYFDHRDGVVHEKHWDDSTATIGERLRRWVQWPWR